MTPPIPSTPDPATVTLVASFIRHLLTFLSGMGMLHGAISDSMITVIASAVVGMAMAAWALYQKYQAAKADHAGSVASANAGQPLKVATA